MSMSSPEWALLIYHVPAKPTALRAAVRRRLLVLRGRYLRRGVAALPASASSTQALRELRRIITEHDGTAHLLRGHILAGDLGIDTPQDRQPTPDHQHPSPEVA